MKDIYIASYSQDNALFQKVITCFNGQDKNLEKFVVVGEKIKNKETKNRMELEFDRLYEKILNIKYTKEIAYTYLKELKRYHSITARLLEAYLYFISGNAARTERIILDIVKKNLLEHSLNSDFRLFSYEDQKKKIFNLLEILKNEQLHNKILDNLLYYFYYGTSGPFQKELSKKFPRNENITHLRKLYNSAIYGKRFPYVWSLAILQNGSLNEYSKYIAESTTIALLENGKLDALSFFCH